MHLVLTPSAAQELERLLRENPSIRGIRFGVEAGGCAGLSYRLQLAEGPQGSEITLVVEGITFFVDPAKAFLWDGVEIDYPTGLSARGFVFRNPQARSTCGCGTSFAV